MLIVYISRPQGEHHRGPNQTYASVLSRSFFRLRIKIVTLDD